MPSWWSQRASSPRRSVGKMQQVRGSCGSGKVAQWAVIPLASTQGNHVGVTG
jgi:hypothetical protein